MILIPDGFLPARHKEGEDDDLQRFHKENGEEEVDDDRCDPLVGLHLAEVHPPESHQGHGAEVGEETESPANKL